MGGVSCWGSGCGDSNGCCSDWCGSSILKCGGGGGGGGGVSGVDGGDSVCSDGSSDCCSYDRYIYLL